MPIIDINLLRQQQTRVSRLNQATFVVAVVCATIVGLQFLIVVFLFSTEVIRNSEKASIQAQQKESQAQIDNLNKEKNKQIYGDMDLTQQTKAYDSQITSAASLIDSHKYFSLYLSEIAVNTPTTVDFTAFSSDGGTKLLATGNADSYGVVAELASSFKQLSFAKNVSIQEAKLDPAKVGKPKSVKFALVIELKSAAELNRLPGPGKASDAGGKASVATPAPKPSAAVSPGVRP